MLTKAHGQGGDHDVLFITLHLTLHRVQDLPIKEERLDSNLVVETLNRPACFAQFLASYPPAFSEGS